MTLITKADGFLSFNGGDPKKLSQVRLCSGPSCRVIDVNDYKGELEANLIENKKVTATFGDAITLETSVQVSKECYRSGTFWAY